MQVIQTFHGRNTENIWKGVRVKKFEAIARQAQRTMQWLEFAIGLRDLKMPGLRLEKLSGARANQYSIRVNDQYRVCFEWKEDGAYEVELTDYH